MMAPTFSLEIHLTEGYKSTALIKKTKKAASGKNAACSCKNNPFGNTYQRFCVGTYLN